MVVARWSLVRAPVPGLVPSFHCTISEVRVGARKEGGGGGEGRGEDVRGNPFSVACCSYALCLVCVCVCVRMVQSMQLCGT